jgi:hypothetical protein
MKKPTILSTWLDAEHNMTYRVFAYRALTELEMIATAKMYLTQPRILRLKSPERNKTVTTDSLLGSELPVALGI